MEGCDWVAHLAMAMGKKNAPDVSYASGTVGTFNVLQAAEAHGVTRIVSYSSVNAMGLFMGEDTPDFLPLDETHVCRPGRPYGTSKYLGEQTCRLFTRRTGIPTVCIRPPAVWTDKAIESIKEEREKDAEFEWTPYWEYGCYIHVEDLARATLCALTCPDPGHIPLLVVADDVSSAHLTSRELVQKLLPDIEWRGGDQYEADPYKGLVDNSRAKEVLGWAPEFHWRSA
jgi:nucleoside-diphosphate-sugar epimerase